MRTIQTLTIAFAVLASAGVAYGHGFSLSLQGNALSATSNDFPGNGNPNLFLAELSELGGELRSSHGGAGASLFGTGKELSFDVFSPLWYSNGNGLPATLADSGISLTIDSQSLTGSVSIDRDSTTTPGYAITGNTSHEFLWTLASTGGLPEGVYGIAYRVKGNPVGGAAYEPTPLLVVSYMTPNFFPGNDPLAPDSPLSLAQNAVYEAATNPVPEPSSCILLALGAVGLLARRWHRGRKVACVG